MAISPESLRQQDEEFWLAVKETMGILVPVIGISYARYETMDLYPTKKPRRLKITAKLDGTVEVEEMQKRVCYHADTYPVDLICDFFATSPSRYVPVSNYICDVSGQSGPLAIDEKGLLILLWNMCKDSPDKGYITALCRKAMPFFRQGDGKYWNDEEVKRYDTKNIPGQPLRQCVRALLPLWVRYVKQHYDRRLLGTDSESRLWSLSICLEGLRNLQKKVAWPPISEVLSSFCLLDDTLCLVPPWDKCSKLSATKDAVIRLFEWYDFPSVTISAATALLQEYQSYLIDQRRRSAEKKRTKNSAPCLAYADKDKRYEITFNKEKFEFICKRSILSQQFSRDSWRKEVLCYEETKLPLDAPKEFLYQLTGGDFGLLHDLAVAIVRCVSTQKSPSGAIILPENGGEYIAVMIEWLTGSPVANTSFMPLSGLVKNDAIDFLITQKAARSPVILAIDYGDRFGEQKWDRLSKLIRGATVTSKDSVLGRKKHKNDAQWLIFGNEKTALNMDKHHIPYTLLNVSPLTDDSPNLMATRWLQFIFPLWGMMPSKKKPGSIQIKSNVIDSFFAHKCVVLEEDGEFLPARTLFDAYTAHCQQTGEKPLLFKDFNDIVEETYQQKRVRCHKTDGSNKTGYYRLRLVEAETTPETQSDKREEFFRYVDNIQSEVLEHFPDFPFRHLLESHTTQ